MLNKDDVPKEEKPPRPKYNIKRTISYGYKELQDILDYLDLTEEEKQKIINSKV